MNLSELLEQHSRAVGIPLRLNDKGQCHLIINEEHIVNVEMGDSKNFFFYSEVIQLGNLENEAIFKAILQANLYGKRTQGMNFGLDSHGTQVILFKELFFDHTDFVTYMATLQLFVNQISYWKKELQKLMSGSTASKRPKEGHGPEGWIKL